VSAALQALNAHGAGLTVDGSLGPRTARALQKFLGVDVDARIGPQTVRALQRRVGAAEDGVWGKDTTSRLQKALNAGTFWENRWRVGARGPATGARWYYQPMPRVSAVTGFDPLTIWTEDWSLMSS
jgi:peptidoglycan hydrolase-like protein with peptidoglycan-binding domain